ncbi:MAG: hypothetical protein K2L98_02245, partial [Bacilli bacterium]|nr:hypothetical protein [Bacilli bacterium]
TLSTSTSTNTTSTTSGVTDNIVSDPTTSKTTTTKSTKTTTNNKETSKKTTTKKQSSKDCNLEELDRIAQANKPDKYAVWKTKPTFNVPDGIEYGVGYQKFFWMWHKIGTITDGGVTRDHYIWVVASDKESGAGYPSGEGNTIHEIKPSGHFKNAMKYMIPKPTTDGTKEGERRGVVSLYYFTSVTSVFCN